MEKEQTKPAETEPAKGANAADISARIVALQGDSDEYAYAEPPPARYVPPVVTPKARFTSIFLKLIVAAVLFGVGVIAGTRIEKNRMRPSIAVINKEPITFDEFAHASEMVSGRGVLQRLIDDKLVIQFARKKGVLPDQHTVDARYNEVSRLPNFFATLKRTNQTVDDYKHELYLMMTRQAIISNGIKVNPSDVAKFYARNIDPKQPTHRFLHPENVQIQVIINPSQDSIEEAKKELDSNKMVFAQAVLKYSIDISKNTGGVLRPIFKGTVNTAKYAGLDKILFDMQSGQTSAPQKIGANWWIIKCLAHNQETVDPFEKVQDDCTTGLLVEQGIKTNGTEIKQEEKDFVKQSTISIPSEQYSDLSPKR